jgi:hypothetical protein
LVIPKKYWFPILYGVSILFFIAGMMVWLFARWYQPAEPTVGPVGIIKIAPVPSVHPVERYQSLMSGRLFFGGSDPGLDPIPVVQFHSRLILWGVIKDGQAVVGLDPNSHQDTRLVGVGDVVEGETITGIGDGYIVVKNQTGQGRIRIAGE